MSDHKVGEGDHRADRPGLQSKVELLPVVGPDVGNLQLEGHKDLVHQEEVASVWNKGNPKRSGGKAIIGCGCMGSLERTARSTACLAMPGGFGRTRTMQMVPSPRRVAT